MQEHFVDYFIFLSNTYFSSILKNAQFEISNLARVLNANNPLYLRHCQLFTPSIYIYKGPSQLNCIKLCENSTGLKTFKKYKYLT